MEIRHNLRAINNYNKLRAANLKLAKSTQKLSSGYRINVAADDAAGLSVSEKLRSQIKGLSQATRNAQDGINYIQTGEGALQEIHSILQRAKSLSTEAANGPYSEVDREAIQLEIDELRSEVDHIAGTDFNGKYIFDIHSVGERTSALQRSGDTTVVMLRSSDGGYIPVVITDETLADNIATVVNTPGKNFTEQALTDFSNAIKENYLPKVLDKIVSTLPESAEPTFDGMGIGYKLYYEDNNVLAYVSSNGTIFQLGINVKYLDMNNGSINMPDDLASTITHEMVHAVMDDIVSNGMAGVNPSTGIQEEGHRFPKWFIEGMAQAISGGMDHCVAILPMKNDTSYTDQQLSNATQNMVKNNATGYWEHTDQTLRDWLSGIQNNSEMMPYEQGYFAVMYLGYLAGGRSMNGNSIAEGLDKVLSEIESGKSLNRVIRELTGTEGTDDFVANFAAGGSDVLQFAKGLINISNAHGHWVDSGGGFYRGEFDMNSGTGALATPQKLSGPKSSLLDGSGTNNFFVLNLEEEWVENADRMGPIHNRYEGGSAIEDGLDRNGNPPAAGGSASGSGGKKRSSMIMDEYQTLTLQVGSRTNGIVNFTLAYHTNAIGDLNCDFDCSAKGLGLDKLSLATQEGANEAIDCFDFAINKVSMMRASFGAVQNRLEHKIATLASTSENITRSESDIRDTDMATEMVEYTKQALLSNAIPSLLAQANAASGDILSLLES